MYDIDLSLIASILMGLFWRHKYGVLIKVAQVDGNCAFCVVTTTPSSTERKLLTYQMKGLIWEGSGGGNLRLLVCIDTGQNDDVMMV